MVVPVTGHVPDSTLSPYQVRQKFASQSVAGLGDLDCGDGTCLSPNGDGTCAYCDYSNLPTSTAPPIDFSSSPTYKQPDGSPWPFDSAGITPATAPNISVVSARGDAYGNIYTVFSNGTYTYVDPTGKVLSGVGAPPAAGSGNTTVTAAQANTWASLIGALAGAGVKLGTVAMLQPGQSLLPNGTILGSGQALVGAGGSGINSSFASILQNPMLLIGGFGILALLVLSGGRR